MNETEQEKSSSRVSQTVEEWCKCGKCEPILTERECRCCHEAASHYLNVNIRGGSRNFVSPKLEIFAINDSQLPDASDCHKGLRVRCLGFWVSNFLKSYLEVSFDLIWYVYLKLIYTDLHCKTAWANLAKVAQLIKTDSKLIWDTLSKKQ